MDYTEQEAKSLRNIRKWIVEYGLFPGSVGADTAACLYHLIRETQPDLVFEIGCYLGFSTLHIAKGLKENRRGRLVSFDLGTLWASAAVREAGLAEYVQLIQGCSDVSAKQYVLNSGDEKIDILFIDGDHTRRGCVRDFNTLESYVREGGYVIFHDIYPKICGWYGPRMVISTLREVKGKAGFAQFDITERRDLDPFGVALCRKISSGKNPLSEGSWLHRLDVGIKTSKVFKLIELMMFEAMLPPGYRDFFPRMKALFANIFYNRFVSKIKARKQ